jgi:cytochrome c556
MRFALLAVPIVLLAGCGGPETSQANNSAANISKTASPPATASASTLLSADFSPVTGDEAKRVMHERHEGMEAIGKASKALKRELEKESPDISVVRSNADRIAGLATKAAGWFRAGTGPDVGKTGAKPEIWQNEQDFLAKLTAFQGAATAFHGAAGGNDLGAIKGSFGDLGKACKACHDKYRSEMKH